MYHYTESGLQNVYLQNGYKEIDTPYGKAISIDKMDGLHQVIAQGLLEQPFLSGREFRFLRVELGMTQREIGEFIGVSAQSVALYEKSARVQKRADQMIRAIYKNVPARQIREVLDNVAPERFVQHFRLRRHSWGAQAA
jgi:DNA-binding XRE family transcriptional regulator